MRNTLLILLTLTALSSCGNEQLDNADSARQACEVELLFSPHSLGDDGYSDLALYGVSRAQAELGFEVKIHNPQSLKEGIECFEQWKDSDNEAKRLFVFCSNSYEDTLRQMTLPQDDNCTVMIYETENEVPGAISFKVEGYGAACYLGQIAASVSQQAAVLLANEQDKNTESIAQGFADGYLLDNARTAEVPFYYLAEGKNEGYAMEDEAYKMATQLYKDYDFIFPIAGKSNRGVYKYTREDGYRIYTAGIDNDMSAYSNSMLCSLVKRMDTVMYEYVKAWYENPQALPAYKHFLYTDGYVEMVIADNYKEFFDELLASGVREELEAEAIEKEAKYVKN